jgi:hypothetical protein
MKENYIETTSPQYSEHSEHSVLRRVSWGAVFAGVIVTVVLQLLFTLLGVGIGAATVQPLQQSDPGKGLGMGTAIWLLVSTLISVYIGARVAGGLCGCARQSERGMHGILAWGTTAIASIVFLTSAAGTLFGGAASFMGSAAARMQPGYANVQPSTASTPANLSPTGREGQDQQMQTEQRAREAGDVAARRVSQSALWSFLVLILSGVVAGYGGRGSRRTATERDVHHAHPQAT